MTYALFHMSIFQLADMWCDGVEPTEYVSLLELLLDAISYPLSESSGRRKYRALADIVPPLQPGTPRRDTPEKIARGCVRGGGD